MPDFAELNSAKPANSYSNDSCKNDSERIFALSSPVLIHLMVSLKLSISLWVDNFNNSTELVNAGGGDNSSYLKTIF